MSNITLYYCDGLNRFDTPVFDSSENQALFFSEQERYVVPNDSFYVPKFKDEIVLSTDDADFNDTFNYLSLTFKEKNYYYFIDKIEYVSEDAIRLYITLDVIQTYMFNINFISSEITRKSIKRWINDNDVINRDYIRENYSNGTFQTQYLKTVMGTKDYGLLVLKLSDFNSLTGIIPQHRTQEYILSNYYYRTKLVYDNKSVYDRAMYVFVPFSMNSSVIVKLGVQVLNSEQQYVTEWNNELPGLLTKLLEIPNAIEARIYPGAVISMCGLSVTEVTSQGVTTVSIIDTNGSALFDIYSTPVGSMDTPLCRGFIMSENSSWTRKASITIPSYTSSHTFDFSVNTAKDTLFSPRYCPQLLDENYVRIRFGERTSYTTYPLHKLLDNYVALSYVINVNDNTRMYRCDPLSGNDVYMTTVYSRTFENLDLYNSPYREYLSQNQASLTRGIALAKTRSLWEHAKSGVAQIANSKSVGEAVGKFALESVDTALDLYSIEANKQITLDNLEATPSNSELLNSGLFDLLTKMIYPICFVDYCTNERECAEIFESFGYAVHEISTGNLFELNNRYYYDVVQCASLNINLLGVPSDEQTISWIKDRFRAGLRLWHTTDETLNVDTVEGVTLSMGQVCVYDNVEV